jgi:hypothetical protein
MIEEDFILQEYYSMEEQVIFAQDRLLTRFALFCGKLYTHQVTLQSATIRRTHLPGIYCIKIIGKVSGEAANVAAMMLAAGRIAG